MVEQLKRLKDFDGERYVDRELLRQEAIKWIKHLKTRDYDYNEVIEFIKWFFNLREEELKFFNLREEELN